LTVDDKGAPSVALVNVANRGIGVEVRRRLAGWGMKVVLGARDPGKGEAAAEGLTGDGLGVIPRRLNVSEDKSVRRLAAELGEEFGGLDVLLNNAGINFDFMQRTTEAGLGMVHETFETNFFGATPPRTP
jgi:NAD(P)-dependent dehydrogenase (short-subunit alcohol dehydrogenase family)